MEFPITEGALVPRRCSDGNLWCETGLDSSTCPIYSNSEMGLTYIGIFSNSPGRGLRSGCSQGGPNQTRKPAHAWFKARIGKPASSGPSLAGRTDERHGRTRQEIRPISGPLLVDCLRGDHRVVPLTWKRSAVRAQLSRYAASTTSYCFGTASVVRRPLPRFPAGTFVVRPAIRHRHPRLLFCG